MNIKSIIHKGASDHYLLNAIKVPICRFRANGAILQFNVSFAKLLLIEDDHLRTLQLNTRIHPEYSGPWQELLLQVRQQKRELKRPLQLINMASEPISAMCLVVPNEDPEIFDLVIEPFLKKANTQETPDDQQIPEEIKQLKAMIMTKNSEQEILEKDLEQLAYCISHDLRAPLRHIEGFTQMTLMKEAEGLSAKGKENLQFVLTAANRLQLMINEILEYSRARKAIIEKDTVALIDIVELVKYELEIQNNYPKAHWEIAQLPNVYADRKFLKKIMHYLLDNAVKYSSKEETPTLEITCEEKEKECIVSIQDNGAGFDMRFYDKL
ncbi:MAG: histidine kinase dimerization/phospho-acceptor domain-containing protein, partial [Bacteroidota bacterium]